MKLSRIYPENIFLLIRVRSSTLAMYSEHDTSLLSKLLVSRSCTGSDRVGTFTTWVPFLSCRTWSSCSTWMWSNVRSSWCSMCIPCNWSEQECKRRRCLQGDV